jgi:hypothetical protein
MLCEGFSNATDQLILTTHDSERKLVITAIVCNLSGKGEGKILTMKEKMQK